METIFENEFTCTKDYYREYYRYINLKKPLTIIINIILSISLIIGVVAMTFPNLFIQDIETAMANIASVLIIWCVQIYVIFRNRNLAYSRDLEINNGKPVKMKLLITENSINIITNSETKANIELTSIERVVRTKNYYILVSKSKLGISLKKNGFIKGTMGEFEKFLKQKGLLK